jgi:hypothetical protein
MKYYRLLKDTPEAPAGTMFEQQVMGYDAQGYDCYMTAGVVENSPNWFEEVVPIYVRPFNAPVLKAIDDEAKTEGYLAPLEQVIATKALPPCEGCCEVCEECE